VPKHFAINLVPVGWALYEEKYVDHRELFANFYLCTEEQEGIQAEAAQPGT